MVGWIVCSITGGFGWRLAGLAPCAALGRLVPLRPPFGRVVVHPPLPLPLVLVAPMRPLLRVLQMQVALAVRHSNSTPRAQRPGLGLPGRLSSHELSNVHVLEYLVWEVWGLGFGFWGLGFEVWDLGFRDLEGALVCPQSRWRHHLRPSPARGRGWRQWGVGAIEKGTGQNNAVSGSLECFVAVGGGFAG